MDYCLEALHEVSPPVLVVVLDARRAAERGDTLAEAAAFSAARGVAADCVAVAAMQTGIDTTVFVTVVRSDAALESLVEHIDRGRFDPLSVGGRTVIDAERLRGELPFEAQARDLS